MGAAVTLANRCASHDVQLVDSMGRGSEEILNCRARSAVMRCGGRFEIDTMGGSYRSQSNGSEELYLDPYSTNASGRCYAAGHPLLAL